MPGRRYMEEMGSATMLATKRSTGVAPRVNFKECAMHIPLPIKCQKSCHTPVLKPRGDVTKSQQTGVSVAIKCKEKNTQLKRDS